MDAIDLLLFASTNYSQLKKDEKFHTKPQEGDERLHQNPAKIIKTEQEEEEEEFEKNFNPAKLSSVDTGKGGAKPKPFPIPSLPNHLSPFFFLSFL